MVDPNFWVEPHFLIQQCFYGKTAANKNRMCFFLPFRWTSMPKCYPCYFWCSYIRWVLKTSKPLIWEWKLQSWRCWMTSRSRQSYLHKYWYKPQVFCPSSAQGLPTTLQNSGCLWPIPAWWQKLKMSWFDQWPKGQYDKTYFCLKNLCHLFRYRHSLLGSLVQFHLKVNFQDTISQLFFQLTTFLHKVILVWQFHQ